jgi:hypothetical protein
MKMESIYEMDDEVIEVMQIADEYEVARDFACDRMVEMLNAVASIATSEAQVERGAKMVIDKMTDYPFFAGNKAKCVETARKIAQARLGHDNNSIAWFTMSESLGRGMS